MQEHSTDDSPSAKSFKLRSRLPVKPLNPDTPRFHIFLVDSGWNRPVSKARVPPTL
jgi:hypothetical protein